MTKSIVLLGYMGSGKSAIGTLLADKLECSFIDLDSYISNKEGRTISQIFDKKGEVYFRKKEMEYLRDILRESTLNVISLGGGTPCYGDNIKVIEKSKATSIYLKCNSEVLCKRLEKEKQKRPLIAQQSKIHLDEFIKKHLFEREPIYKRATHTLNVENLSLDACVREIISLTK